MRVLFDSNLLLRAADPSSVHHTLALQAISRLASAGAELCLCGQNLYEFWTVSTRPLAVNGLGLSAAQARVTIDDFLRTYTFLPETGNLFAGWLDLVTTYAVIGKQAHDTRLVALMLAHGVQHLLTFNMGDFRRYAEITALDPAAPDTFPSP